MLTQLNLPPYDAQIDLTNNTIYDRLRLKHVALTPEEWVRQNFVAYLINTLRYPAGLMGNEVSLTLNNTRRRCDTVVFDRHGKPWMIIEYKAPHISITREVFEQAARYNLILGAKYLTVTNGLTHYCLSTPPPATYLPGLPAYPTQQ